MVQRELEVAVDREFLLLKDVLVGHLRLVRGFKAHIRVFERV